MAEKKCSFGIKQKSLTSNIEGKLFLGYQTNVAQRVMPLKNSLFPGIFYIRFDQNFKVQSNI